MTRGMHTVTIVVVALCMVSCGGRSPVPRSLVPPDVDRDGIPDDHDQCPLSGEERWTGPSEPDGCPENDPDGDAVTGATDECPGDAEDLDLFADGDGCPDPDNDGDAVPDVHDQCPDEPEDLDGVEDVDGCPDAEDGAKRVSGG